MKRRIALSLAGLVAASSLVGVSVLAPAVAATDGSAAVNGSWGAVVGGDEFNQTSHAVNTNKWSVYDSAGHAGKGIRSPEAWWVHDGMATVKGDSNGTTGGMSAKWSGADVKYGRWEVRMKTYASATSPRDPKYHPVLILWPANGDWPCGGEVDFSEGTSTDVTKTNFFYHYSCENKQTSISIPNDTSQWHNYAVQWTQYGITGYIDGEVWFTDYDTSHLPKGAMHLTVQLDWFPESGKSTQTTWMDVDWARQYAPKKY